MNQAALSATTIDTQPAMMPLRAVMSSSSMRIRAAVESDKPCCVAGRTGFEGDDRNTMVVASGTRGGRAGEPSPVLIGLMAQWTPERRAGAGGAGSVRRGPLCPGRFARAVVPGRRAGPSCRVRRAGSVVHYRNGLPI